MSIYKEYEAESIGIITEAKEEFGDDLYALSSFGNESALLLKLIQKSGVEVPVLTIDTGFWFKETHAHKEALEKQLSFEAIKYRVNDGRLAYIEKERLWETNLDRYNEITKLRPLSLAIGELGVKGLLAGVRSHQNDNRANLETYGAGSDGEWRVHPVLSWTQEAIDDYFAAEDLPRHPLHEQGYGSIGDWTLTTPGQGRSGRNLGANSECGLHLPSTVQENVA